MMVILVYPYLRRPQNHICKVSLPTAEIIRTEEICQGRLLETIFG